ncbi:hypothetical protein DXG03_009741 [Asterophora parasitica]|uniref:Origin recognition complex subunit 1 n=1 Tax=Asterophora parasitica TaxID=117018 RepID=A0A9P7GAX5_9AGAR|nr:hypothetical protein DXG03_009741 [Asterophora parasitica]
MSKIPPQTPRRSNRNLPLATPAKGRCDLYRAWIGDPLYTRPTNPDLDLVADEDKLMFSDEEHVELETVFYRSLEMKNPSPQAYRSKVTQGTGANGDLITYNIGDTVLVKTDGIDRQRKPPSVAIIVSMWETRRMGSSEAYPDNMRLRIHWFLRPTEGAGEGGKRDHAKNEIYYTLNGTAYTFPQELRGHCRVTSTPPAHLEVRSAEAWAVYKGKKQSGTVWIYDDDLDKDDVQEFFCRFAIHGRAGYFYDFRWNQHRLMANISTTEPPDEIDSQWGSGWMWNVDVVKKDAVSVREDWSRPNRKKRQKLETIMSEDEGDSGDNATDDEFQAETDDKDDDCDDHLPQILDGEESDLSALSSVPTEYHSPWTPSRTKRKRAAGSQSPTKRGSMTATPRKRARTVVHPTPHSKALLKQRGTVLDTPSRKQKFAETYPFTYVEINGLKIPEPSAAYNLLYEGVSGHDVAKLGHLRVGAKESLKALTKHFSGSGARGPGGHACVVLMDELDQLVTTKQDVVYNFFNWPTLVGSKLIVIAVANTMDLPERVMSGRVRSRLGWFSFGSVWPISSSRHIPGMIRINFQPYNTSQLVQIVQARLQGVKDGLEDDTQEALHPDAIKLAAMKLVLPNRRTARAPEVREVIKVMQNSPTAAYLRECSFHERMMLASLIKCIKREGVDEIKWGEVQHQHLIYMNVLTSPTDSSRKPTPSELALVLDTLVASRAMLVEEGAAVMRKAEGERKVLLNLEPSEVERVLSEVGGERWKNVLSA